MAKGSQMATETCVNIGSGNGFLPGGTKLQPEVMLTCHKMRYVAFISEQLVQTFLWI